MNENKKTKGSPGCLVVLLIIVMLFIFVIMPNIIKTAEESIVKEDFEQKTKIKDDTFQMYQDTLKIMDNLSNGIEQLVEGNIDAVSYYDFLTEVKRYSTNQVNYLNQEKKKIKNEKLIENLRPYESIYEKLVIVSANMLDNLESPNLEVLSRTKKNIEEINLLIPYVKEERFNLLLNLGYNEEEANEILENEESEL